MGTNGHEQTDMGLKAQLENMCFVIDDVLAGNGLTARVAGGYVAGNGVLFSLTETTFVDTHVRLELEEALQVSKVLATVGVVLVNGWLQRQERAERAMAAEAAEALPAPQVDTLDVLDLIRLHEAEQVDGRSPLSNPPAKRPSAVHPTSTPTA